MRFKNFTLSLFTLLMSFSLWAQDPVTEICLVTVDTTSTYNIVAWERLSQSSLYGIDSMRIYRETLAGSDSLIATVDYSALSEYKDSSANPNLRSYTYRIAGVDIFGTEGALSPQASTIHFALVENTMNELLLKWTPYEGRPINFYQCWDIVPGIAPDLINETTNSVDTAWVFAQAVVQTSYSMKVDVNWASGCTSTKANHNTTRSNQAQGLYTGTGPSFIDEHGVSELRTYPNPTEGIVNLSFSSLAWAPTTIKVYDITGKVVLELGTVKVLGNYTDQLDLSSLEKGLYTVVVDNGTPTSVKVLKK